MRELLSFLSGRERRRRKAATWFARMRGPSHLRWEPEFRGWYDSDARNAEAYDRMTERWRAAAHVTDGRMVPSPTIFNRPGPRMALVAATALLAVSLTVIAINLLPPFVESVRANELTFETRTGETRGVTLDDGSRLTLDSQSKVRVKLGPSARRVTVDKGRVRIEPARDRRPLIVSGDREVIVNDEAAFDASVRDGHLTISPLDMSPAGGAGAPPAAPAPTAARTSGILEFDGEPLRNAIARANQYSSVKIILADRGLGEERLTGQFRAGDIEGLSTSLAAAFTLSIERPSNNIVVLRRLEQAGRTRK